MTTQIERHRAPFRPSDLVWFVETIAKLTGDLDPTDFLAHLLLIGFKRGRFGLDPQEHTTASTCAVNRLTDRPYRLERHHLDGDRSNNSRINVALTFQPTHQIITRDWLRVQHVESLWREELAKIEPAQLWVPPRNWLKEPRSPR